MEKKLLAGAAAQHNIYSAVLFFNANILVACS